MIECTYTDHEIERDHATLASASEHLRRLGRRDLLLTCHRVEAYDTTVNDFPLRDSGLQLEKIVGTDAAFDRLARIAAGTKSQIIGEWPIRNQVHDFVGGLPEGRTKDLGEAALQVADSVRSEENFYSPDHATIALQVLQKEAHARLLVVFGAGMLGQNLVRTHKQLGFDSALLITRNKKKARRKLRGVEGCHVQNIDRPKMFLPKDSCHVVVASTHLAEPYLSTVRTMVGLLNCGPIVDVCGESIFFDEDGHISLEGPTMRDFIQRFNSQMEAKRKSVEAKIALAKNETVRSLENKWKF